MKQVVTMRLQIRLGGVAEKLFKSMVEQVSADKPEREVVLDALAVYDFAIREKQGGRRVGSYDPDTREFKEITTLLLGSVRPHEAQTESQAWR
jgi:hypothetical protein